MHGRQVQPEIGVGDVGDTETGWVREVEVDDECRQKAKEEVEAKFVEANEGVLRPDHAIPVAVPEQAVLLEDGLCVGRMDVSEWTWRESRDRG